MSLTTTLTQQREKAMPIDVEKLALEAGISAAQSKQFRRERGQQMPLLEQESGIKSSASPP